MGVNVYLVGPMPTPAIAHLTRSFAADAGIVISASHNPAEDNGIKIFTSEGFKLPDKAEREIEKLIFSDKLKTEHIQGKDIGKAFRIDDANGRYIEFVKNSINNNSLKGLKVVIDCANGAAHGVAREIFRELGAEIVALNFKPDGLNINLECGAMHPEVVKSAVLGHQADLGIALDGDADRVIIVDEKGNIVDGDHILAIAAIELKEKGRLKNDTIVATNYSNLGLDFAMKKHGINVVKTDVGDRYVIEEMRKNNYILGGEQSGHIIFFRHTTTGDGLISALQIMNIMKKSGKKLSELKKVMQVFPQVLVNVKVKEKKPFKELPAVSKKIDEIEKKLGEKGRVLIRYSGTENLCRIMIEGKDETEINKQAKEIEEEVKKALG